MKHVEDQMSACPWLFEGETAASTAEPEPAVPAHIAKLKADIPVSAPRITPAVAAESSKLLRALERMRGATGYQRIKVQQMRCDPPFECPRVMCCAINVPCW